MTTIAVYNFGPGRHRQIAQVRREARALARTYDIVGATEAKYALPRRLPTVHGAPRGVTPARRNLATYAKAALRPGKSWTKVLKRRWGRRPGRPGLHEPRAIQVQLFREGFAHVNSHAPPMLRGKRNSQPARTEWLNAMVDQIDKLAQRGPVVVSADWNSLADEATKRLRSKNRRVQNVGHKATDRVLLVGDITLKSSKYVSHVGGVKLGSDHKDALVVEFQVGGTRDHGHIVGTGKEGPR